MLTWLAYGAYYLCRRPFAICKTTLENEYHLDLRALGHIDTGYLVAYAVGQFAFGLTADRIGSRRLLGFGMLAVAALSTAFGLASHASVFAISFAIQGLFQATGWPGVVKAMTSMYHQGERGTVMGLWATCYQAGGLAATGLATWLLYHFGWRMTFIVPAAFIAAVGVAVFVWLWEPPSSPPADRRAASLAIIRDPLVWTLGAAYFCIKLIRYCIVGWLPYFLERRMHYGTASAGWQSTSFEIGGVVGALLGGRLFDRAGRNRGWLIIVLTIGLAISLLVYPHVASLGPIMAFAGMVLVGSLLFGPDALVSSVAAQDLGGTAAAGTAAGFINGIGAIGAILQGELTSRVAGRYGWDALFVVFCGLSVVAALAVVPYAISATRTAQGKA